MGFTYSKFLCEHIIVTGVNDKFELDGEGTVTLTAGRYRDIIALAVELDAAMTVVDATQSWATTVDNSNGLITITSNAAFTANFDTANYGTALQVLLGCTFESAGSTANVLTGNTQHEAGFYPSEPVESDTRPDEDGVDRWMADTFQTQGRTGVIATAGGSNLVYDRSVTILLPQDDLTALSDFLKYTVQGDSFAFYHDRDIAWDGASNEYSEYQLFLEGDASPGYSPEVVAGTNRVWHRVDFPMRRYVEPTT